MTAERIFVGRKAELEQFKKVLEDPRGQAVLVVGHRGMGKSWLIDKMAELAKNHPGLKCGCVRYEVTPTDSVDSTMALMIDNAFDAAHIDEGSFSGTPRRLEQWRSLLNIVNLGDLVMSLRRDPAKNTREQFLERLQLISKQMPQNGRAIFVIDPEKYMQKDSDQSWAIVVKGLPDKIKLVFAQRSEDVLVNSQTFGASDNVSHIPETNLGVLEEQAVDELLDRRVAEMNYTVAEVRKILSKYKGHPYALQGALDLLKAGTKLEELPQDPIGIGAAQWKELCKRGRDAIHLFKAYTILEVGVPDEVVLPVSELDTDTLHSLLADNFLGGLLCEEGYGKRIYHAILADHIVAQIGDVEKEQYHRRAVAIYREKLKDARYKQTVPDALSATRLAEHVLAADGDEAFVLAFMNECYKSLITLGLLDSALGLSERALGYVHKGSGQDAAILGNLGLIYRMRGDLDMAEQMFRKSLEISEKIGCAVCMASQYGNLGQIYEARGDLDQAEQMLRKSLEINEDLKWLEGMANQYDSLGLLYRMRDDLDKAEQMHTKSLEINEKLGRSEGMAGNYGNLGVIHLTRGDLEKAEPMFKKSLEYDEKLGRLEGMASQYGNLGLLYLDHGDLGKAEQMLERSMETNEKLGRLEGMASDYANLGAVYKQRGEIEKAREYWEKSVELFKKIGMKAEIEKVQGWIDELKTEDGGQKTDGG